MGSSSSRSASDDQILRRDASAGGDRHGSTQRSSSRRNSESMNVQDMIQSGSHVRSSWPNAGTHGDRYGDRSVLRGQTSMDPGSLPDGANGGGGSSSSSSHSSFSFSCYLPLESSSLPSGGEHTPRELEAGGSRQGSVTPPLCPSAYMRASRGGSSTRIHEEDAQEELPVGLGSRQPLDDERLHAACETTLRRHRVNEMQERLRRYAGLPSSLDLHELERQGVMSSEAAEAQHRMEVMSGTVSRSLFVPSRSDRDTYDMSTWAAPSLLQAWDNSDVWEGTYVGPNTTVASSGRTSPPPGESSGVPRGNSSGRETRRTSGRRIWDALSRATSHRRSATPTTAAISDDNDDVMHIDDVEHVVDVGGLHGSRTLDLEERRRRVRSQVWALRRLSNGLEGVPWHSRTCPGNHHGHRCSCDAHGMGDDTNTRASISRIIMLAEALFEVLDEIHRQSIALSQSATVSLASLPAPSTVVDAIPVRIHAKAGVVCDETAQCYICLVEYEEGDHIRILPCHHEYHKGCVDKWLKEVHRVCPLCRGNVCEVKPSDDSLESAV